MTTAAQTKTTALNGDVDANSQGPASRRLPVGVVVAVSMLGGLVAALVLILVVFAGATEPVITGAALLGFACGWALLAVLLLLFGLIWEED